MLRSRMNRWAVLASFAAASLPLPLAAQTARPTDVPIIEPTFTRIFGSDTLEIFGARMSSDGHWVVFRSGGLWLVSAAGGEPTQVVEANYGPDGAVWFPTSDRVAFRATQNGHWPIMTVPIDRETGQPAGPPRPVTLEGSSAYFDVSPDGKWIAYTPMEDGQRVIRIVPSNGGVARTLIAADTPRPMWSTDGHHIYYYVAARTRPGLVLMRVAVEGGEPDTVITAGRIRLGHSFLVLSAHAEDSVYDVTTLEGEPRARFRLPQEMRPGGPDANNRFLATLTGFGAALQILPVNGGPTRRLTEGRERDTPLGWTDDDKILFSTELNGKEVLLLAPVGGGPMRQVSLSEERLKLLNGRVPPPFLSRDGSRLFYQVKSDDPELSVLKVLSLESGTTQEITSAHPAGDGNVAGPGGLPHFNGQDFLYVERKPGGNELWAWTRENGSRLLRKFDGDQSGRIAVHGDRIIFAEYSDDRATLRTATLGDAESRELASVVGWLQPAGWSPNGQHVAMVHVDTSGGWESARVAFLRVSPSGEPIGDLRYVSEPSLSWWNLRWLPDSRGVLAAGWDDHNLWFLPVDPSERSVSLTEEEPRGVGEFVLSPDGKHIVYPSWQPRGSSIWLVDLGEIPGGSK